MDIWSLPVILLSLSSRSDSLVQANSVHRASYSICTNGNWNEPQILGACISFSCAETSVWNRYLCKLGSELSSQKSDCLLSFQLARLKTNQVGNIISPTWFADHSMVIAFSWAERMRRFGIVQTRFWAIVSDRQDEGHTSRCFKTIYAWSIAFIY